MGHREVYKVEVYARVRRAVQMDGMSIREAARQFGLSRKTSRKMMQFSLPPSYGRKKPVARPKLGPWLGIIDQILADDQSRPRSSATRPNASSTGSRPSTGFGGHTIVKDSVRQARLTNKEVFVLLAYPPSDTPGRFRRALLAIAGVQQKAHFQCFDLPYSDDCFVNAFPAENSKTFLEDTTSRSPTSAACRARFSMTIPVSR